MPSPTPPPEVSIIMVSYNTSQMTCAALASVYEQTKTPFEMIVVDNASPDTSAQDIAQQFPQAHLIAETTNHGFGPAHDIATPHATAPWILLLNPDTLVLDGAIDKLLAFAKAHPDNGIWGGRTVFADGSLNPMSCFGRMTLWSTLCRVAGLNGILRSSTLFNSEYLGTWPRDTVREVDIVSGCFFLMRRKDWDDLDGLDPVFAMYGEEVDLCLRARAKGLQPIVTPDATIVHYAGASEAVESDKMVRLMRAKVELIKRHFHPATRDLGRVLFSLWPWSRTVAMSLGGKILGRDSLKDRAATWRQVWDRRAEWKDGFTAD